MTHFSMLTFLVVWALFGFCLQFCLCFNGNSRDDGDWSHYFNGSHELQIYLLRPRIRAISVLDHGYLCFFKWPFSPW